VVDCDKVTKECGMSQIKI